MTFKLSVNDFHSHISKRMNQRGITRDEVEFVLHNGWEAEDAVDGTSGKTFVFDFQSLWENKFYHEKEVTVYFKFVNAQLILLTAKARYGSTFERKTT